MTKDQCRVGMEVVFGRRNGEQTKAKVVKMNPTKAKVETLVERGHGRGSGVGAVWNVPYSMMMPLVPVRGVDGPPPAPAHPKLAYSPFMDRTDYLILSAMQNVYNELSPENLSCDGELPMGQIRTRRAALERKLRGLTAAFGRAVDEIELMEFFEQERQHRKTA